MIPPLLGYVWVSLLGETKLTVQGIFIVKRHTAAQDPVLGRSGIGLLFFTQLNFIH